MCGIAGWFESSGRPIDSRALRRMGDALAHRGPNGEGLWLDGSIGLVHRRLAIRDLSEAGRQPMSDPDGRVVVTYNGELYNDDALRGELERDFGVRFRTSCDTEILPHAYLAWGEAMFDRLEGMFAIGLWDVARRRLLLARDGIGIKPLYYAEAGSAVLFASEIKALVAGGLDVSRLDPEALHTFLAAGHAGTQRSLIDGVAQVGPGSVVAYTPGGREAWTFWTPSREPDIADMEDALALTATTLEKVVASQLVSDVPLGILQSGGIDSTLVSLAVGHTGARPPLFTASFEERSHDETDLARAVAAAVGLPHRIIPVDSRDNQVELFRAVVHAFDGQCADTGALAFYRLSRAVRRYSTVALSGDGGDEFFCGYETYAATWAAAALRLVIPPALARSAGRLAYHLGARAEGRLPLHALVARLGLGLGEGGERPHLEWRRLVPAFLAPRVYGPEMSGLAEQTPYGEYAGYYDSAHGSVLDAAMLADQRFHLQSVLAKVDAMSMAHGLEIRVPLLDRRVMELAGRMDLQLLHPRLGRPKYLLRRLALQLGAPKEVTRARKKGFNMPIARLLRRELRPLGDDVLDRQADVLSPYLSPDGVRALWQEHREGRIDHAFALWPILTLATWRAGFASTTSEVTQVEAPRGERVLRHAAW